ncbi:hypothetical protein CW304_19475 [Bacillus sp. UFRGS-B20]|nr:hypothetical protein CW304_19475 [Bacillus sp. UFRGS-B20]
MRPFYIYLKRDLYLAKLFHFTQYPLSNSYYASNCALCHKWIIPHILLFQFRRNALQVFCCCRMRKQSIVLSFMLSSKRSCIPSITLS